MKAQTAVVLGATGFIGGQVVEQLISDPAFDRIRLLVRKPVTYNSPKVEVVVTDFDNLTAYQQNLGKADCIFCCIGTTMKKVKGDKVAYRKIDFDIPVYAAKFARAAGVTKYLLVSSVGANVSAGNFYLALKGEVEEAITAVGLETLHVFRPSMLLGERKEFRLAETVAKGLWSVVSPLLFGKLGKYKGIKGKEVAKAMVEAAKGSFTGVKVWEYKGMKG